MIKLFIIINTADIVGSTGVFIVLLAFILNLISKLSAKSMLYIIMNVIGGSLSCLAAFLINYIPFIFLEAAWTIFSVIGLIKDYNNKHQRFSSQTINEL